MNLEFAEKINADLQRLDFVKALKTAESELKKLPPTPFHEVIGKSLTNQADDLATWIEGFFEEISVKETFEALYFEMNEFDINTDLWYINGFAYYNDGGLHLDDMDWLSGFDADSRTITGTACGIDAGGASGR